MSQQFIDPDVQATVKKLVPDHVLGANPQIHSLLAWFKGEFMQWTPKEMRCTSCKEHPPMQSVVEPGLSWKLRKSEYHTCQKCGYTVVFPRYGEIPKIAQSRTGRCSEWSMLFGAILGSVGMPVRIVQDYLDHCWNEVQLGGKWVHIDSTLAAPISYDHPHYYEQNWGKKYIHVLAFQADSVQDVTERYTEQLDVVLRRRADFEDANAMSPQNLQRLYSTI